MGDFKEPTALLKKSRGISPMLAACPISDAPIICGNVAVYAIIIYYILLLLLYNTSGNDLTVMIFIMYTQCHYYYYYYYYYYI